MAVAASIVGGESYADRVRRDGPLAYWRLGEAGGLVAADRSGNGRVGTFAASGLTFGRPGALSDGDTAIAFDGTAAPASRMTATLPALGATFSCEAWVITDTLVLDSGGWRIIAAAGTVVAWGLNGSPLLTAQITIGGTNRYIPLVNNLVVGALTHLVVIWEGSGGFLRIYRNGILDNTTGPWTGALGATSTWIVGQFGSAGLAWKGLIDELAIYPVALTARQVAEHYALRTALPSGLRGGGSAPIARHVRLVSSGGVRVGGSAAIRRQASAIGSGGLRVGGAAVVTARLVLIPDSSEIDNALVAKLLADPILRSLAPDGVFWEEAGPSIASGGNATRFVLVSLVDAHDEPMFEGTAFEDALYLVKFVSLSTSVATAKAAAARIHALLHLGTLTIPGYVLMVMRRVERVRLTEVDEADKSIRWFHRGGRYQVMAAPIAA